ncbi:hypothetical protein C8Q70DRAFT_935571 [Cubamyces menziesii]|nr:hypothetical protein C8Q70DRAFT_935571 [Cubamyces menziesii]
MSQDFCLTAQDPDVLAFLEYAGAALLYAEKKAHGKESEAKQPICNDLRWHDISQGTTWWRVEYGGVAHPEAVANVVGKSEMMSLDEARLIFVVAALSVYNLPSHPAHWAFWARWGAGEKPMRIALPSNVAWIDLEYNLIGLRNYQRPWLPQIPQPQTIHIPAVDPKKAAVVKGTRTSARCAAAQAKVSTTTEDEVAVQKSKNGKRARDAETDGVEGVAPKRAKRATSVKGKKTAGRAKTQARTKGGRATRATTSEAVVDVVQGAPSTAAPSKKARSKARATKKTSKTSASSPIIHIVPPPKDDSQMDVDVEVTDEPLATTSAAVPKLLLKVSRTSPNADDAIPSSSSPSDLPGTSASSNPTDMPSSRRSGTRRAHRRVASRAESDVSELSTAPSATTTLVPTPDVSDGESTRAGTPDDLKDKAAPGEGQQDTTHLPPASICAPVRVSARIRAKKESTSPASSASPSAKCHPNLGKRDYRFSIRSEEAKRSWDFGDYTRESVTSACSG